jgi:Lrp/AsnC family transcriptional regulator, leucine-responsive regulatory protein
MDDLDGAILAVLRHNARATLGEIGAAVGLSGSAVKRRIDRLERDQVILGYTALVDERRLGRQLEAFTELTFAGDTKVGDIGTVAIGMPEVVAVFTTAGDPDALVHLRVSDVNHLTRAIDRLRRSGRITGTKTLMVLDTWRPGDASDGG